MATPPSPSLVSRARTAFHSAAARVLTDLRSDVEGDGYEHDAEAEAGSVAPDNSDGSSDENVKEEATEDSLSTKDVMVSEDDIDLSTKLNFPTAFMIRNLAMATETGKRFNSIYDLRSAADSFKGKTVMGLSVVKSLVRRDKNERPNSEFAGHEDIPHLLSALFSRDVYTPSNRKEHSLESRDIHGAPVGCFVHQLSVIFGSITSLQQMALLWEYAVVELRKLWAEEQPVPRMPIDGDPDLNCCLLHQQIQVINCCISRKKRKAMAKSKLEFVLKQANSKCSDTANSSHPESMEHRNGVKNCMGEFVPRLGADYPSESLTMLETGEPIYFPILQEGPILTEETIKETEEFVLRTGSFGAGCSHLLSDMQAFKAANPGCVLEDFVRWHSPLDWTEVDETDADKEGSYKRGQLSSRMQKKGNLWRELWETAKPLPAVEQTPLFDEDLAVENIFIALEDMPPSKLMEQLLHTLLSVGLAAAEAALLVDDGALVKMYNECKDYIIMVHKDISKENLDEICKVYETIEAIVVHPEEAQKAFEQSDERGSEMKSRLRRFLSLSGGGKRGTRDDKKSEERSSHVFSSLLERKVSFFKRKNSKDQDVRKSDAAADSPPSHVASQLDDGDWTVL